MFTSLMMKGEIQKNLIKMLEATKILVIMYCIYLQLMKQAIYNYLQV